jgi:ABC-type histidine transport system ATPase subunit
MIECRFDIPAGRLAEIHTTSDTRINELLNKSTSIVLKRSWSADLEATTQVGGEIEALLLADQKEWSEKQEELSFELDEYYQLAKKLEQEHFQLEKQVEDLKSQLGSKSRGNLSLTFFKKRSSAEEVDEQKAEILRNTLSKAEKNLKDVRSELDIKNTFYQAVKKWKKAQDNYFNELDELKKVEFTLHQRASTPFYQAQTTTHTENQSQTYRLKKQLIDEARQSLEKQVLLCGHLLQNDKAENAAKKAESAIDLFYNRPSLEKMGHAFIKEIPRFELFEDFGSLLPNRIDLNDIIHQNKKVEGYKAARNLLTIAGLDHSFFLQPANRILKQKIENLNDSLTLTFHEFWQQHISSNNKIKINFELNHYDASFGEKAGQPYLEFWIKDEGERLYPKQRSRGVRWFLSFYIELKAAAIKGNQPLVLLVDEPGVSLHARAQEDVLKVFEDVKDRIQIIYSTHSPHLVDTNKLHRILAVQRSAEDTLNNDTYVLEPSQLTHASPDTLSPLQSIMGNPMEQHGFSLSHHNIIVNDTGTFYLLNAILKLSGYRKKLHFIPSTDASSIPLMCNILMGWGLSFSVLVFATKEEKEMAESIKERMFPSENGDSKHFLVMPDQFSNAEDLFSTLDFKKHILKSREGITTTNSLYLKEKNLPRNFLLSQFLEDVSGGRINYHDHDEETQDNISQFIKVLNRI